MSNGSQVNEKLIVLPPDASPDDAIEALEAVGARVLHHAGARAVIIVAETSDDELRDALPVGARIIGTDEQADVATISAEAQVEEGSTEQLTIEAFRLRQSREFRQAKANRPNDGQEWGRGGLPEPDVPHDDEEPRRRVEGADEGGDGGTDVGPSEGAVSAADEVTLPTNERLINRTGLAVVYVDGPGEAELSTAERVNILAEVQEGLGWLSGAEPDAKAVWQYQVYNADVSITPWEGARWPGLPATFYRGIDAAFVREDNGRLYMFKDDEYARFSSVAAGMDSGYPKPIAGNWPGLPASFDSDIDAALWRQSNDKVYLFKGDQYVRFSNVSDGVDPGYPKPIAGNWPGMPASFNSGIDAALMRKGNGKIYMFKDDEYVRFSSVSQGVDSGYPKPIAGNWPGMPDRFNDGIDAALWRDSNEKIYFFKRGRTYGTYVRFTNVPDGVDPGYENGLPIGLSTREAELLWRSPALQDLGYAGSDAGKDKLVADLKDHLGSQWAYCAFFTKHPTTWFAYAGGHRVVMRYGDFTGNFDRVFAHETGHIFGAPDEYGSSNCGCGQSKGRFFRAPNNNCANCEPDPADPCIMRSNSPAMCAYTPWHLGWGAFMTGIDAAGWRLDNDRLYMFSNEMYLRFTDVGAGLDDGYPRKIGGNWPGLPSSFRQGIDAALWRESNGKLYFFKGNQYVRFSNVSDGVDSGYPKPIAGNWPGLPASFNAGIDAALMRQSNGKIYFFKGNQYVRFSRVADGVDAGYPRSIAGNWPGLTASYNNGIDAALMRRDNDKIYFFKNRHYVRYTSVNEGVDDGYPAYINRNWMPFPV